MQFCRFCADGEGGGGGKGEGGRLRDLHDIGTFLKMFIVFDVKLWHAIAFILRIV